MKIVVIGGTGLIGSKTVAICAKRVTRSSPARPKAASTPSPARGSKRPWPARRWRSTSPIRRHLKTRRCWNSSRLPGATFSRRRPAAGVRHHVALSIVGTDRSDNGYFRAKVAQEKLIKTSGKGGRGVYVRAQRDLLPPRASDMLPVRNRAIDGIGLSPTRFAALPAATRTFGLQTLRV